MIKKVLVGILVLLLAALAVLGILLVGKGRKNSGYMEQLALGDKYLEELDYENAQLCFEKAIEIDEKRATAYVNLSAVYVLQNRYEEAIEVLDKARKNVSSQEGMEKIQTQQDKVLQREADYRNQQKKVQEQAGTETMVEVEVSQYLEQYQQMVPLLGMEKTSSWQFGADDSYQKDGFYLEWQDSIYSMKNEGASYVKLYGTSLGDSIDSVGASLQGNNWVEYSHDINQYKYAAVINDKEYLLIAYLDEDGRVSSWYLNNWPEGEELNAIFEQLRQGTGSGDTAENSGDEGFYEYSEGELLSQFSIDENNQAYLGFWHNYGDASSEEDFSFTWEPGKWEYQEIGMRSQKNFTLRFTPTDTGMSIQVTCADGIYYSWKSAQPAAEWSNLEYQKIQ